MPKNIKDHIQKGGNQQKYIRYRNGVYEIRMRIDGVDYAASAKDRATAIKKFIEKVRTGPKNSNTVPTNFDAFSMFYFETYRKRKVTPLTLQNDMYRYRKHVQPTFGSREIPKITPTDCQQLLDTLAATSTKTCAEIFSLLNGIFKMAIAHSLISKNPLAVTVRDSHQSKHGKALTKEQEKLLLESTAGTRYQLLYAVALYTGMRPNEYKTARIEGDFIIAVNSKRKKGKLEYKKIPIIPMLKPYLVGVQELHFVRLEYMRIRIKEILPDHILYDLRTTFYTRCEECGVSDAARDEFVGHSRGALNDAYSDLSDEYLLSEGNKLIW